MQNGAYIIAPELVHMITRPFAVSALAFMLASAAAASAQPVPSFAPAQTLPTGAVPAAVAIGDFDENGTLDIATSNAGANSVTVYFGTGTGSFTSRRDVGAGAVPHG